jgi:hypothetical protein
VQIGIAVAVLIRQEFSCSLESEQKRENRYSQQAVALRCHSGKIYEAT